ncbi:MAG TPA: DNA primase, partial [Nitratifractor sp.]|nr:DNA primase [Nitratifractor sp.]
MIEEASIERLKTSIDIVDVIGNYLELKKSGANFKANCPFHGEKTPSFVVSPQKQIFHCFGCGAGGDAIKFVMDIEKLSYPEAIEKLASNYNIPLSYTRGENNSGDERRILELMERFYKENLAKNSFALEYLEKRGVSKRTIEHFSIGYVGSNNEVMQFLKQNQIPLPKALEVGILAQGERGDYYARLIERVTFPIFNSAGAIVGFGGRTLGNHPAKYINSPQTKFFNKSRLLYGYYLAKNRIYKEKTIIVTEGYLDVIMLHQAGFENAVATLGTALTNEHLPILKKGEPKVIVAYDGDSAGVAAALKAAKMLSSSRFEGSVVLFPNGMDPADMVANGRVAQLTQLLKNGTDIVLFVLEQIRNTYDLNNPHQKERAITEAKQFLATLSPIAQESYIQDAARIIGVQSAYFKARNSNRAPEKQAINEPKKNPAWEAILKTLLERQHLIDELLDIIDFSIA